MDIEQRMERKVARETLRGEHSSKVLGWVRPGLSGEKESVFRERLIRQRFEHVDGYLIRIDECLRELTELAPWRSKRWRPSGRHVLRKRSCTLGSRVRKPAGRSERGEVGTALALR